MIFSAPLRAARTVLFRNTKKPIYLTETRDLGGALKQHNLGTVRGYSYDSLIDGLGEPSKMVVESQEELLRGLSKDIFDLAIIDLGVSAYLRSKLAITNIVRVEGYEIARVLHVAFQMALNTVVDRFNAGLETVKRKGIRDRILAEYGVSD